MIESLHIDGFRGLDDLRLDALGQFNLIVGAGNAGKTNLLEALFLFCSTGEATPIKSVLGLRRINVQDRLPKEVAALVDWFWSVGRGERSCSIKGIWNGKHRLVRLSKVMQQTEVPVQSADADTLDEAVRDALAVYQVETVVDQSTTTGRMYLARDAIRFQKPTGTSIPGRFISPLEQGLSRPLASVWSEFEERSEGREVLELLPSLDPEVTDVRIVADEIGRASLRVVHKRLGRMPLEFLGAGFGKDCPSRVISWQ